MPTASLDEEDDINRRYDDPAAYGPGESCYGDGKYPPDWDARREAVWGRQRYQCGRCRRYKGDVSTAEVHHVVFLSEGGSNDLENLVGLCGDCHRLMHPDIDDLRGSVTDAPVFPDENADDRVAVIREPDDGPLRTDVTRLSTGSSPGRNAQAVSSAAVPTGEGVARRAEANLQELLVAEGYVPRTSAYHLVRLDPAFEGYRGVVTSYTPDLNIDSDAEATETQTDGDGFDVFCTSEANHVTVTLTGGDGETVDERLWLSEDDGARYRVRRVLSPPPLTARTAPRYALDTARYFGWHSLKWGALPGVVLAWQFPQFVPFGGSIAGLLVLVLLIGLLVRAPWTVREFTNDPDDEVVNQRDAK